MGRKALPQHQNVERVETGCFQADVRRDLAGRVHLGDAWRQQQLLFGELCAPVLLRMQHPVLLAGRIGVVATGLQACLDHHVTIFDERADHVAYDLRAAEQLCQRLNRVLDLDDLVVGGFDAGNLLDDFLHLGRIAAGGDEGNVVFAQIFADQAAGVAGDAIDDDGLLLAHIVSSDFLFDQDGYMPMPPSTGRPAPVMKRASLEHRKTAASAMSLTSARRPRGVCSMTEATAALGSGASPTATMSAASCMPMSVGARPG